MQFLLLITHDDAFVPTQKLVEDILAWDARWTGAASGWTAGRSGRRSDAVTVRVREGAREVTAGPPAAGPAQTAAYELLECGSLDEAVEAAAAHPMAAAGTIEVRPVWEQMAGAPEAQRPA